jgi:hypothetical protein
VTDQNPAEPEQTGVHESFGGAPTGHESFGSAPASGSGQGHESAGSAGAPSFAPPVPSVQTVQPVPAAPVEAPKAAPVQAPVEAPKAPPVVPAQSSSPAVERAAPAVGTAQVPAHAAPAEPTVEADVPAAPAANPLAAAPAANPLAAAPAKGKGGGAWKWIVSAAVILAVAVAAIAIIVVRNSRAQDAINAIAVGDCVDSTQYAPELGSIPAKPTVSCDDAKATHKVIGIVDGQSAASLDDDAVCTPWPQTTATIWLGEHDKSGKIYCLADLGR